MRLGDGEIHQRFPGQDVLNADKDVLRRLLQVEQVSLVELRSHQHQAEQLHQLSVASGSNGAVLHEHVVLRFQPTSVTIKQRLQHLIQLENSSQ